MLHPDLTYRYSSTLPSFIFILPFRGFPGGSVVKNLPAMQETWSPGWEDSLEEEMAIQSSILTWRIPRTEEPGGLQSMGSQRAWLSTAHTHTHTHTHTQTQTYQIRSDQTLSRVWLFVTQTYSSLLSLFFSLSSNKYLLSMHLGYISE